MIDPLLKLYLLGFDNRGQKLLSLFISRFCTEYCCIVCDKNQADAFMVNMHSIGIEKDIAQLKLQYPKKPIIHQALYFIACDPHFYVSKPLQVDHFHDVLRKIAQLPHRQLPLEKIAPYSKRSALEAEQDATKQVYEQLDEPRSLAIQAAKEHNQARKSEFVGESSDIDLSDEAALSAIYFEPKRYFLSHVQQALHIAQDRQKPVKLTGLGQTLIICPCTDSVYSSKSDTGLRSLCVVALYDNYQVEAMDFNCEEVDDSALEEKLSSESHFKQQTIQFLWKIILWTARGRLPEGTDLDQRFQLDNWPNLTRLVTTPYAFRITAYWINKPRTLRETLDELGLEQRYVFSLYSAMLLTNQIHLIQDQKQGHHADMALPKVTMKTKKLFRRLIKKLKTF